MLFCAIFMAGFLRKAKIALTDWAILRRILFILFILLIFRILASVPIPGIDTLQLQSLLAQNQFLGLLNIFSGGGLSQLSIAMLGVGAFITSSIIMQLATQISPKIKSMYTEEGEIGRRKFRNISRYLTVPIAAVQGSAFLAFLTQQGILMSTDIRTMAFHVMIIVAGSMLLMWMGELITEFGIGNGVSVVIFAGIVVSLPALFSQLVFVYSAAQLPVYAGIVAVAILVIAGTVMMNEADRPIPINYTSDGHSSSGGRGVHTFLPIKINQAGVMPIIFALSIIIAPPIVAGFFADSTNTLVATGAQNIAALFQNEYFYTITYFLLTFFFTYFFTSVVFDPYATANRLQGSRAFIPGVRPGEHTAEFLGTVATRTTFFGATFLASIAVLPIILQAVTGNQMFAIGGTALLIVVSVVLDISKKIDAQIAMREY